MFYNVKFIAKIIGDETYAIKVDAPDEEKAKLKALKLIRETPEKFFESRENRMERPRYHLLTIDSFEIDTEDEISSEPVASIVEDN